MALAGFLRLRRAGLLTRGVAALHPMLRDRCAADAHDAFAPALLAEVAIGCASKLAAQAALMRRGVWADMDLVVLALLLEAAGDVIMVCLFAPAAPLSRSEPIHPEAGLSIPPHVPPASVLTRLRRAFPGSPFSWGRSLPAFAAQPGDFSYLARAKSVAVRAAQLMALGLAVCIASEALRREGLLRRGAPSAPAVTKALGFGAFLATATNLRYQALACWEARALPKVPREVRWVALLAARFANAILGGALWLQIASLL
ncbi:hypothetical protein T484DRAFT_1937403 [Baffinella frigidus]|nr:hypothetical protein T484DRAFT_1937403 [Cryptophyta sp. CCMP2293]